MNASEWSNTSSDPSLRKIFLVTGCVSAAVIIVALLLAFNRPIRRRTHRIINGSVYKLWPGWSTKARGRRGPGSQDLDVEKDASDLRQEYGPAIETQSVIKVSKLT